MSFLIQYALFFLTTRKFTYTRQDVFISFSCFYLYNINIWERVRKNRILSTFENSKMKGRYKKKGHYFKENALE